MTIKKIGRNLQAELDKARAAKEAKKATEESAQQRQANPTCRADKTVLRGRGGS